MVADGAAGVTEIAFAGAAMSIADAELLGGGVDGRPEAILDHALRPHVGLDPNAWLAVGGVAREGAGPAAGRHRRARHVDRGRSLRPRRGRRGARVLAENGVGSVPPAVPLPRDAGRLSPLHGAQTARLLGSFLRHLSATPHGLQAVLETVVEHGTRARYGIEDASSRAALERMAGEVSASSKLGKSAPRCSSCRRRPRAGARGRRGDRGRRSRVGGSVTTPPPARGGRAT